MQLTPRKKDKLLISADGNNTSNADTPTIKVKVAHTGGRPVKAGNHYHLFETNPTLSFDRNGARRTFGFKQKVMGNL